MRSRVLPLIILLLFSTSLFAQTGWENIQKSPYQAMNGNGMNGLIPLPYSPRALPDGTASLWTNPAGIGVDGGSGFMAIFTNSFGGDENVVNEGWLNDWGIGINLGSLAYGVEVSKESFRGTRHTIASSAKIIEGFYIGSAYHWSSKLDRSNSWDLGLLMRPTRWLSVGLQIADVNNPKMYYWDTSAGVLNAQRRSIDLNRSYHLGLAVRPLIDRRITLATDITMYKDDISDYGDDVEAVFSGNFEWLPGLTLRGGYAIESETVFAGISFTGGFSEIGSYLGVYNNSNDAFPDASGVTYLKSSSDWRPTLRSVFAKPKKVVTLNLTGNVVEEEQPFSFFRPKDPTVKEILDRLERVKEDDEIAGLLIQVQNFRVGFSDAYEIREAIKEVREAGKKVVFNSRYLSLSGLYLASAADDISMFPMGGIDIHGLYVNRYYLKNTLAKLGIEGQFVRYGKYKSAVEMFTAEEGSDDADAALDAVIEDVWQLILTDIAAGRNVSKSVVEEWIDGAEYTVDEAVEKGIIDAAVYQDEHSDHLKEAFGFAPQLAGGRHYFHLTPAPDYWEDMTSPKIAVVYAVGAVTEGTAGSDPLQGKTMGSKTVANALSMARNNKRVKAIVFRVDSPGGSAVASQEINRQIELTVGDEGDERNVPLIVSMSDVAGSGGYWISAKADKIVACPGTITGSIGGFTGKFILSDLYDKIGVNFDPLSRGENSNINSTDNAWDEKQVKIQQRTLYKIMDNFHELVAEGRGMEVDEVKKVGQGRIWSGEDAKEIGLVDEIGGLKYAIDLAAQMANLEEDEYEIVTYPNHESFNFKNEMQTAVYTSLPEPALRALRAQAWMEKFSNEDVKLLTPVDQDALILE